MKWQLQNLNSEQRQAGARAALSTLLFAVSLVVTMPSLLKDSLLLVAYVLVGGEILAAAVKNLRHGRLFDENFLMAIATIGALLIGQRDGRYIYYQLTDHHVLTILRQVQAHASQG